MLQAAMFCGSVFPPEEKGTMMKTSTSPTITSPLSLASKNLPPQKKKVTMLII